MTNLVHQLVLSFAIALGVVLGGSLVGTLSTLVTREFPVETLTKLAGELKIWAMVSALGGTFEPIRNLESGLIYGQVGILVKQLLVISAAFAGSHLGYVLILRLAGDR